MPGTPVLDDIELIIEERKEIFHGNSSRDAFHSDVLHGADRGICRSARGQSSQLGRHPHALDPLGEYRGAVGE